MQALKKIIIAIAVGLLLIPILTFAEDKPANNAPGTQIQKLTEAEKQDAPILSNGHVYPFWGPICQRYTYSVIYRDPKGRAPEYVRIYFNGQMIDMEKENFDDNDYTQGVKYIYKFVPKAIDSNFYYFEASNGSGKARESIIDSPDNGPVLFDSDFKNNEITLFDKNANKISWSYPTHEEWIGGVALSDNGKYLAAKSSNHVYLFDTASSEPLWIYDANVNAQIGGDVKGGVDISSDGEKIFAVVGSKALLFNKNSNKPTWEYDANGNAYNVSISADGKFASSAMAGGGSCDQTQGQCESKDALILWNTDSDKPLWQYETTGNFHDVSLSVDGSYLASATGCPDRRAYIFSKDSNNPIARSEMLTKDSPVDEASISADGTYSAFGSESAFGAVFLFDKNSSDPLWKFETPNNVSVRALSMTPDAQYIGAATMTQGHAYIFSRDSNSPIDTWDVDASLGAADIADDGSYIAVGGTDKKVHIFKHGQKEEEGQFDLSEFVGELDISGNGTYIAAGTSGSVYFFESLDVEGGGVSECTQITEPAAEKTNSNESGMIDSYNNDFNISLPLTISLSTFILSLIVAAIFLYVSKKKTIQPNKTLAKILLIIIVLSLAFTIYFALQPTQNNIDKNSVQDTANNENSIQSDSSSSESTIEAGDNSDQDTNSSTKVENNNTTEGACGNSVCEPDYGENQDNCPGDCSNGSNNGSVETNNSGSSGNVIENSDNGGVENTVINN